MPTYPEIQDKLMSLSEAVKRFIKDGSQIALGGFTVNVTPWPSRMRLSGSASRSPYRLPFSGQSFDVLIGAGSVRRVELAYGANGKFARRV